IANAFPGAVDQALFDRAQARMNRHRPTDQELVERLRQLLAREGRLSRTIINNSPLVPALGTYLSRFKTMSRIYSLVGCPPKQRGRAFDVHEITRHHREAIAVEIVAKLHPLGAHTR